MRRTWACLALALLAGCGRAAPPTPPSTRPPAELTASLEQSDGDAARHLVSVVLTAGREDVAVRAVQLRGGGFVQVAPTPRDDLLGAGARTAVPVGYGVALCQGRPAPVAVLVDTPAGRVEVAVDGDTLLPRLRAAACPPPAGAATG